MAIAQDAQPEDPHPPRTGLTMPPGRLLAIVLLTLLGMAAGATSSRVVDLVQRQASQSRPASTLPAQTSGGVGSSSSASSSGASSSSAGSVDAASIAARVDRAVVDITTTLAGRGGRAAGTGMVISSSGKVLTNNHVIEGASRISVQVAGTGPIYTATVLGTDKADDVALIQIQGVSGLPTVSIGDSSTVAPGDAVIAIGNALGQGGTPAASQGVITAIGQAITADDGSGNAETLSGLLQLRASIQPGDSGGPLVDMSGKVIGMDTAAQVTSQLRQGSSSTVGYAIPVSTAMSIVRLIESGGGGSANIQIGQRAILGVSVQAGGTSGAAVLGVQSGSPAESAGLATGDLITSLGGRQVTSADSLSGAIHGHRPGDRVAVTWINSAGEQLSATVTLVVGPPA